MPDGDVPNAGGEPTEVAASAGMEQISQLQAQLERANQRVAGMQGFYERATKAGFDKPERFDEFEPLSKLLSARKMTPAALVSFLSGEHDEPKGRDFDPDEYRRSVLEEVDRKMADREAFSSHRSRHEQSLKAEQDAIMAALADIKDEDERSLHADALRHRYSAARANEKNVYENGNPLREFDYKPLGEVSLKKLLEDHAAYRKKLAQVSKGESLLQTGKAAGTPAGASGGQEPNEKNGTKTRKSDEEQLAFLAERRAKRQAS